MRIGELASRSGVSTKTIRYYETIGLVPAPERLPSGYRQFDDSAATRLAFIRAAQAVGLSLGEIRSIVALRDEGETPCGYVVDLLRSRTTELDRRIAELRSLRSELVRLVEQAQHLDPSDCEPSAVCHLIGRPAGWIAEQGGSGAGLRTAQRGPG
ncbi:MAG: heavy metal-responsive transcriptional regulator [Actinobacteria bacterium]|nr:heavy metal-responsive transcriptional regulator [Actinomycetota bacterium]